MGQACAKAEPSDPIEFGDARKGNSAFNRQLTVEQDLKEPLIHSDQIKQNKQHNDSQNEDLMHQKEQSVPATVSSDEYVEDPQLINDVLHDAEQLLSINSDIDSNTEQPEASPKTEINNEEESLSEVNDENKEEMDDENKCNSDDDKCDEVDNTKTATEDQQSNADSKYSLPTKLSGIPRESLNKLIEDDHEFAGKIQKKYGHQIEKHLLEKCHFTERYVIGYRHIKSKKREAQMFSDIDYFFEIYAKYEMDNIINTQSTENELNAWKQFLYGEVWLCAVTHA